MNMQKYSEKKANTVHEKTWKVRLELKADALKSEDILPYIVQMVVGIQELHSSQTELFIILSELYNNALDHGILRLDSRLKETPDGFIKYYTERQERLDNLQDGYILIEISNTPIDEGAELCVKIEDSGNGFDSATIIHDLENNISKSGRGIPLVYRLCNDVVYNYEGNAVSVKYHWK